MFCFYIIFVWYFQVLERLLANASVCSELCRLGGVRCLLRLLGNKIEEITVRLFLFFFFFNQRNCFHSFCFLLGHSGHVVTMPRVVVRRSSLRCARGRSIVGWDTLALISYQVRIPSYPPVFFIEQFVDMIVLHAYARRGQSRQWCRFVLGGRRRLHGANLHVFRR
jgi:hypothetical protein